MLKPKPNKLKKNNKTGRRKNRMMMNCKDGNHGDDIICDILSRCPVKSLVRFKCVCKRWRYLIEQDQHFIHSHHSRSTARPSLLITTTPWLTQPGATHFFFADDLFECKAGEHRITTSWQRIEGEIMLKPVNGLICFVNDVEGVVRIYNLSSREITPWMKSSINTDKFKYSLGYGFGFDPLTKQHKVVFVWSLMTPNASSSSSEDNTTSSLQTIHQVCEVLTVGDNTWRRIDEVPKSYSLHNHRPIYVNGFIYWLNGRMHRHTDADDATNEVVIIAFDVGSEKFRYIPIPSFILGEIPRNEFHYPSSDVNLAEVDGHIAVRSCQVNRVCNRIKIKMWILYNDDDDKSSTSSSSNWIEETISICLDDVKMKHIIVQSVQAIPGRKDLIMIELSDPFDVSSLYFYDRKKKTYMKKVQFSINHHDPSSVDLPGSYRYYEVAPFVESLFPVQKQLQRHYDDAPKESITRTKRNMSP